MEQKKEGENARTRFIQPLVELLNQPLFRRLIQQDRQHLGIDPARRRAWEQEARKQHQAHDITHRLFHTNPKELSDQELYSGLEILALVQEDKKARVNVVPTSRDFAEPLDPKKVLQEISPKWLVLTREEKEFYFWESVVRTILPSLKHLSGDDLLHEVYRLASKYDGIKDWEKHWLLTPRSEQERYYWEVLFKLAEKEKAEAQPFTWEAHFPADFDNKDQEARLLRSSLSFEERCELGYCFAGAKSVADAFSLSTSPFDEDIYFWLLCYDFEDAERQHFLEQIRMHLNKVDMCYWTDTMAVTTGLSWDQYKEVLTRHFLKPWHLFLDVTVATRDDIIAALPDIQEAQRRLDIKLPRGRKRGTKDKTRRERIEHLMELDKAVPKYKRHIVRSDMIASKLAAKRKEEALSGEAVKRMIRDGKKDVEATNELSTYIDTLPRTREEKFYDYFPGLRPCLFLAEKVMANMAAKKRRNGKHT